MPDDFAPSELDQLRRRLDLLEAENQRLREKIEPTFGKDNPCFDSQKFTAAFRKPMLWLMLPAYLVGIVAIGGGAIGLLAIGGGSIGVIAVGGGAVGYITIGGGAHGVYALGQRGRGKHVLALNRQDDEAIEFFIRWFPSLRAVVTQPMPVIPIERNSPAA